MSDSLIRIGSRGSRLALWQAEWVKAGLERRFKNLRIEIKVIKTTGDQNLESALSAMGDKGIFTREIERALLDGEIDVAVHSLKDLPTVLPEGLEIGAVTKREDVRDVFISHPGKHPKSFLEVRPGARIATGSLRRRCQILNRRPDLEIIDLRGNLNTRFSKLDSSDWDGMILAKAGVTRLGMSDRITEVIPAATILPAVGQGALGIEIRNGDRRISTLAKSLANRPASVAASAERAFLHRLEGGCQVPIGAYARIERGELIMDGLIGSLDGKAIVRGKVRGTPSRAKSLGEELAETLLGNGGGEILAGIRQPSGAEATPQV